MSTGTTNSDHNNNFVFDPPPSIPTVEVVGTNKRFPVHRIYCVGRNYADHVREMGGDPKNRSSQPTFFCKPADAVVPTGTNIPYPSNTNNLHYEVELVVAIGKRVDVDVDSDSDSTNVEDSIFGYAVGIDLTRRDLQTQAKESGSPWDCAKAFDQSAPIGAITTTNIMAAATAFQPNANAKIELTVNDIVKQSATLHQMIWSVPEIIVQLSKNFQLVPGDLIFTGTPSGVGPIVAGDKVRGTIEGLEEVELAMVE
jgi:fumarylpyruvate hydrolase